MHGAVIRSTSCGVAYGIHTFNCVMAMRKPAAMEAN
jgi:hypothetical protein